MSIEFPEAAYWLALAYESGLKLARVKAIVTAWCLAGGRPLAALFESSAERIAGELGLPLEEAEQALAAASRVPEQASWLARLESAGTQLVTRADPRYPRALLRWLLPPMQPLLLFWRGNADLLAAPSAAVIGAPEAGAQAVGLTGELTTLLAEEGLAVVSGLGKGVGQAALGAALSAEGGQSIGVLPMGIEAFSRLPAGMGAMDDALQQGRLLLLSPFHPAAKFSEAQAVARNKLLVGLADALFVVTAGQEGTLRETAEEALRLGKALYVWDVDVSDDPSAAGNQNLIQSGGLPITGLADILEAVEAVVATRLELGEAAEAPPLLTPPLTPPLTGEGLGERSPTQVEEAPAPYDPQAVLDLLGKSGHVPEALARRLRQSREDR